MDEKNEVFTYTYSAKQNDEVKRIREKYLPTKESKMDKLRRLDRGVLQKASAVALTVGIVGILIFGLGLSLILSNLGEVLGSNQIAVGVLIGIVGLILVCCAFKVYQITVQKERSRIAPEIIRLTDELIKGEMT